MRYFKFNMLGVIASDTKEVENAVSNEKNKCYSGGADVFTRDSVRHLLNK